MTPELQVVFRDSEPSPYVEERAREKLDALAKHYPRIQSCRVVVEAPETKHHRKGHLFHVRVELKIPGHLITASRENGHDKSHEDIYVALRDSFDAAKRQLEDYARKHREV